MTADFATEFIRHAVVVTLTVAGPLLLVSLIVGVVVSLIQAITQIQEQTLTFIPKILALGALFILILPWILGQLTSYLVGTFTTLSTIAR